MWFIIFADFYVFLYFLNFVFVYLFKIVYFCRPLIWSWLCCPFHTMCMSLTSWCSRLLPPYLVIGGRQLQRVVNQVDKNWNDYFTVLVSKEKWLGLCGNWNVSPVLDFIILSPSQTDAKRSNPTFWLPWLNIIESWSFLVKSQFFLHNFAYLFNYQTPKAPKYNVFRINKK